MRAKLHLENKGGAYKGRRFKLLIGLSHGSASFWIPNLILNSWHIHTGKKMGLEPEKLVLSWNQIKVGSSLWTVTSSVWRKWRLYNLYLLFALYVIIFSSSAVGTSWIKNKYLKSQKHSLHISILTVLCLLLPIYTQLKRQRLRWLEHFFCTLLTFWNRAVPLNIKGVGEFKVSEKWLWTFQNGRFKEHLCEMITKL